MKKKKKNEGIFARNHEKNDTLNIRRLVNEMIVPATQWTSVSYWRLSDSRAKEFLTNHNSVQAQRCMLCVALIKITAGLVYNDFDSGCSNTMDFTFG